MLCDELGKLLITIANATSTVFGDDAMVTRVAPASTYNDNGIILDIVVEYRDWLYDQETLEAKLEIMDNLIYNPVMNSESILSKVSIRVVPFGQL